MQRTGGRGKGLGMGGREARWEAVVQVRGGGACTRGQGWGEEGGQN